MAHRTGAALPIRYAVHGADTPCPASVRIGNRTDDHDPESEAMIEATELQAAVLRRLLKHLNEDRPDVQNIDLMNLAGFCRNCLADWYREAAAERGLDLTREEARDAIYGVPFEEWKAQHQKEATPEQLAAFHAARQQRDGHAS